MSQYRELSIPVSVVGPGSQPDSEDGMVLDYMPMPNDMSVFHAPVIMDDSLHHYPQAEGVIEQVKTSLQQVQETGESVLLDLGSLPGDDLDFINRFFGEGEVSLIFNQRDSEYRIQETVLAGVWRIAGRHAGRPFQAIEIGLIPDIVSKHTFEDAKNSVTLPDVLPEGIINAPSLLTELDEKSKEYSYGDAAHIVNLTLLPQSPEDLQLLGDSLGEGPAVFLSRGYGSCRVTSTGLKNVWWVQYFNSEDKMILNTIEVVDVPIVTQASLEDIEDSHERIAEMLESVRVTQ
ncbi:MULTISPECIES: hydrogenase expression/formation protein [Thiomicrorhabdus]|uniref:Hydrogenase expression/formation protein n=1 Tax=Thiomicrorhabdus heinhorstiae TaxID=2748010 RepID=A0ABS0BV12_9GAMM|nr:MULTISPECIES: hydrogenase expression/formation protein [Thiomicrorhabdus]MBF6057675.1 hydrogenase expression/formation protein [Thiomicrorhabdus heinhorstiae]